MDKNVLCLHILCASRHARKAQVTKPPNRQTTRPVRIRIGSKRSLRTADLEKVCKGLRLGRQPWRFPWVRKVDDRVVIFGLDSNNHGNLTVATNGVGQLGFHQLLALGEALWKHRDVPVKIVAVHHSPNIPERHTAKGCGGVDVAPGC